jgi:transcriptional regulator with XRE-family HTH domain
MSGLVEHEFEKIQQTADNREQIDYWAPFSQIIIESLEKRQLLGLSQTDLARRMGSKQSVVSRFENMGRKPSYDLIARMSMALGHVPGMTLFGDYMAVVPCTKHKIVDRLAKTNGMDTKKYLALLLEKAIEEQEAVNRQEKKEPLCCSTYTDGDCCSIDSNNT